MCFFSFFGHKNDISSATSCSRSLFVGFPLPWIGYTNSLFEILDPPLSVQWWRVCLGYRTPHELWQAVRRPWRRTGSLVDGRRHPLRRGRKLQTRRPDRKWNQPTESRSALKSVTIGRLLKNRRKVSCSNFVLTLCFMDFTISTQVCTIRRQRKFICYLKWCIYVHVRNGMNTLRQFYLRPYFLHFRRYAAQVISKFGFCFIWTLYRSYCKS